jgi:hypothetical protein
MPRGEGWWWWSPYVQGGVVATIMQACCQSGLDQGLHATEAVPAAASETVAGPGGHGVRAIIMEAPHRLLGDDRRVCDV